MLNGVRPPVSSQQTPADSLQGPGTSGGGAGSEVTDKKGLKNIGMENAATGTNMDGKIRETGMRKFMKRLYYCFTIITKNSGYCRTAVQTFF